MTAAPAIEIQGLTMNFVAGRLSKLVGSGGSLQRAVLKLLGGAAAPVAPGTAFEAPESGPATPPSSDWLAVRTAVRQLDLTVPAGSVYGFLGQNGAGKTTTIKILTGLLTPTAGTARLNGIDVRDKRARRGLGYMPENPYFYEHLRPLETLDFYGRLYGLPAAERTRRSAELLQEFGLAGTERFQVRGFSKGMRQRLGLAQAVMADPSLVILDEPMSGLDPGGRREVKDAIKRLAARGVTVFFSSHILSDVEDLCNRICLIHQGVKQAEGAPAELLDQSVLRTDIELETADVAFVETLRAELTGAGATGAGGGNQFDRRGNRVVLSTEDSELAQRILAMVAAKVAAKVAGQPGVKLIAFVPRRENIESYFLRKIGKVGRSVDALPNDALAASARAEAPVEVGEKP
ncbi:MAG TPA: ABC transporter ATP-binding protein [Planctomycetota bacterium]|nr:ABC transporter ATP-binding protein [Planctomycetota bacterium]